MFQVSKKVAATVGAVAIAASVVGFIPVADAATHSTASAAAPSPDVKTLVQKALSLPACTPEQESGAGWTDCSYVERGEIAASYHNADGSITFFSITPDRVTYEVHPKS